MILISANICSFIFCHILTPAGNDNNDAGDGDDDSGDCFVGGKYAHEEVMQTKKNLM